VSKVTNTSSSLNVDVFSLSDVRRLSLTSGERSKDILNVPFVELLIRFPKNTLLLSSLFGTTTKSNEAVAPSVLDTVTPGTSEASVRRSKELGEFFSATYLFWLFS
jgi:hypothetical protein